MTIQRSHIGSRLKDISEKMSGREAALKMHKILKQTSPDKNEFRQMDDKNKIKAVAKHLKDDRFEKHDRVFSRPDLEKLLYGIVKEKGIKTGKENDFLKGVKSLSSSEEVENIEEKKKSSSRGFLSLFGFGRKQTLSNQKQDTIDRNLLQNEPRQTSTGEQIRPTFPNPNLPLTKTPEE